jgi:hypothetical protein
MNSALASGGRAEESMDTEDSHDYPFALYYFTVDDQVKVFADHPQGDSTHDAYADEMTCTGPFEAVTSSCPGGEGLIVDGCPSPIYVGLATPCLVEQPRERS